MSEQKPPPSHWERISIAAERVGVKPDLLLSAIASGQADIRVARIGRRRMVHVAAEDLEVYRRKLAYETIE